MNNFPSINQLKAFEAVVRYGSVTGAAKTLHLTQAAVSKQISQLEALLSVSLFLRSAEGLELTDTGAEYYSQIEKALGLLESAGDSLKADALPRQRIVMSVDGALVATWLAPRIGRFLRQHPDIDVEITVAKSLQDISGKSPVAADLLIVYGQPPWPRFRAEKLLAFEEFPVCSPEYAKTLVSLDDLNAATLVHEADHTGWHRWLAFANAESVTFRRGPIIYDSLACLTMALKGEGVAIGDNITCADWIDEGLLVKAYPQVMPLDESFYLLMPEVVAELPVLQKFRIWLLEELASSVLFSS